jgi:hypothetical protein
VHSPRGEVPGTCPDPPPDSCLVGSCTGLAYQFSEFFPAGIQFSGGSSAGWGDPPSGLYLISANAGFKFRIDNAVDYNLFSTVDPGDSPILDGGVWLVAYDNSGNPTVIHDISTGQLQVGLTWDRMPTDGLGSDRVWTLGLDLAAPDSLLAASSAGASICW